MGEASASNGTLAPASLAYLGATEAVSAFRAGSLTPSAYLEALIEQRGRIDPGINALTHTLDDEARVAAAAADAAYARADDAAGLPPLLGVPVATKEKHALAGQPLSQGLSSQANVVAAADHPVVERIRAAGGIVHARTTSPEFSCATVTHSPMWGVTRNPWELTSTPGGSSGGAGAALAAGLAPLATASDIAGSTRIPAAFTGTVGYKAPYGRIPGAPPLSSDHYRGDGPMARSVADTALLADVMSGRSPVDHTSWGGPGSLSASLAVAPRDLSGVRVALSVELGDYPVDPQVAEATERAADALAEAGAVVEEVRLPWSTEQVRATTFAHFALLLAPMMRRLTAGREGTLADYTLRFMADAEAEGVDPLASAEADALMQAQLAEAMRGFDALLAPVNAVQRLDADGSYLDGIDAGGRHLRHYWEAHLTSPFNVCNRVPALAVPAGIGDAGVPIGVQIVAQPFDEAMAFRLGRTIEEGVEGPAWPWAAA